MLETLYEHAVVTGLLPLVLSGLLAHHVFFHLFRSAHTTLNAPLVGEPTEAGHTKTGSGRSDTAKLLMANYRKFRDSFFRIPSTTGEVVMLPVKYIEELKALPSDVLSFDKGISERMLGKYTFMEPNHFGITNFPITISQNLTRSLGRLMKDINEECAYAFEREIGPCEDWTAINIHSKLMNIVGLISGRVFVGSEMNRDPEYQRCIIEYTIETMQAVEALTKYHSWLWPLYTRLGWIPAINRLWKSHHSMREIVGPLIQQRTEAYEAGEELPSDLISWNLLNCPPESRKSIKVQAHSQLSASMAAIHTTSLTATNTLLDLASRPEYIQPLREELEAVLAQEKVPYLTKASVPKLRLLDSFAKESQRLHPAGPLAFNRKVMRDITLHDGVILPAGTQIGTCAAARAVDNQVFPNADTFDPWRFVKMREQAGHESRHQFVTPSLDTLQFGYGTHACPGRFFANNELKVMYAYVLSNYDIKMPATQYKLTDMAAAGSGREILMRKRAEKPDR